MSDGMTRMVSEEYKKTKGRTKLVTNWVFTPPMPFIQS